ncbi:MAG TPA: OmpA family protein [Prolixibacteraceae bacterium]|nr:OmpA family protein [Prolixibacteraceae bacterium]
MIKIKIIALAFLTSVIILSGCGVSKSVKGGAIGSVAGGAAGAIIGRATGNTAMGAVIGATVGGVSGAVIGNKMDKQAQEIKAKVPGVNVERVGEGIVIEFTSDVLFGFDKAELKPVAKENLGKLVTILNDYPDTNIEIHGHTDSKGSLSYNQSLSEQRARAVSNYLTNRSIASNRLTTIGFGEEQPKYDNDTANGHDRNRRVEFAISANEKMKNESKQ